MAGKILYALIARENIVLAEFTATGGNFPTVTRMLLHKINSGEDHKMSYTYDTHVFHYVVEAGITYLCMADVELRRRLPFAFLADVKGRFQSTYGDHAHTANAFAMNEDFSPVMQRQMNYYNDNPNADPLSKVQNQIKDVKNVAMKNIEKVLERGEKIDLLVDKTDRMRNTAVKFHKTSRRLKNTMWWQNVKMWLIIVGVVGVVIFVIAAMACGGFSFSGCSGGSSPAPSNRMLADGVDGEWRLMGAGR
eukprot:g4694.t1